MSKLLCIWLVLLPLITWQGHFEVPKVFWLLSGGIFILTYFIFNIKKLILTKKDKWYLLWLISLLASSYFGVDFKLSLLGGSYRHQGVIFFFCLWLVIKAIGFLSKENKEFLYKYMGIAVLIEAILVIFGYKLGTLGEINAVAGFLAIGIFFVYKYLPKYLIVLPLIAMFINFSKSGFLALLPFVFSKKYAFPIIILVVLVFIIKPLNNLSIFENREVIWKHAINLIKERPILGYGAETNEIVFDKAFYESGFPLSNLIIDRAHNLFLDVTLWSGIVGLIFFIGFLIESFKNLEIDRRKLFLSFLIYSMFQPISVAHWILFIIIL